MSKGTKPPTPPGGRVFVGRERELDALGACLADTFSGRGRIVLLVGEPGIGKTRLAEELGIYACSRQAQVLVGRCYEGEGVAAYWPWVQAIRHYVRKRDPIQLRQEMGPGAPDIAQIIWEVRERLPDLPQPPSLDAAQARFHLFDSVAEFLTNAANHQPIALIVDDLHWADTPSLLLLQFLAREIHDARLLVIGCYREGEVGKHHPLVEIVGDLARHEHCQRIFLRGLTEKDVARYIELTAGERPLQSLVARVHRETEGNPLFVSEIVELLATDGQLASLNEESSSLLLPPGVRETIAKRLKRLSEECGRILTIASVIGQEFGLNVLECVSDLSRDQLVKALEEAADARIIAEVPRVLGRYRLAHPLIRETLYTDLRISDRLRLHRQVGEALERIYEKHVEPHLAELAHHFFRAAPAGDAEKAVDYAARAAERSLALLGYEEAVTHYERALQALDLADPTDQNRRCKLLLALGDAQGKSGEVQKARQTFQLAAEIARKLGEPKQLARAAVGTGQVWVEFGVTEEGLIGLLEEALGKMGDEDSTLRSRLLARLALALLHSDSRQEATALIQQAVDMARRIGDPVALTYATTAGQFTGGPDNVEDRLAAASELISIANAANSEMVVEARFWRIHALLELGDGPAVDSEFNVFARAAEELKQPRYLYMVALLRTMRALLEGRFDEAEQMAHETLALGQRWSPQVAAQGFGAQMFVLRAQQGRLEGLEETFKGFAEHYPQLPGYRSALAYIYSQLGNEEGARTEFERLAANDFADLPRDLLWLSAVAGLSEVCAFLGDRRRAAMLYRLLLPYAQRILVTGPGGPVNGSVSHWLGVLARTMSRWDEAARHFEDALASHVRMGARPHVAHTQHDLAVLLAARGYPGDRDRALDLLAQARETTEKLGMASLHEKVMALNHEIAGLDSPGARACADSYDSAETPGTSVPAATQAGGEPSTRSAVLRKEGDYWTIGYGETLFRLKDSLGLNYLAKLLGNPGREFLATDLLARLRLRPTKCMTKVGQTILDSSATGFTQSGSLGTSHGDWAQPSTPSSRLTCERESKAGSQHLRLDDAEPVLDPRTRMEYRRRLEQLREELEEAQAFNDTQRAGRVQVEIDFLGEELAKAVGLGGRMRKAASQVERARLSVTRAIKVAMRNIARNDDSLGRYLASTIKTGTFCSYSPDPHPHVCWRL